MKIGNRSRVPLLQKFTKFNVMRGEDEVYAWVLGDERNIAVCGSDGFVWIGSGIKLVKNTEMTRCGVVHNTSENFHTPARFGLEETVASRRIRDIQVTVKIIIGGDFCVLVESITDLLRETDIE